jgi:outer membrane lipopolysaccharide assembly protein LptE/RlpB
MMRFNVRLADFRVLFLAICVGTILSSCGYTFQGSGSILPPDVKRIYIPLVENNSTESGLTTLFTEALKDRFERFGVVTVVDDSASADAVLKTRILKVQRQSGAVSGQQNSAIELDTTMRLAAELRRVSGTVLWKNPEFEVTQTYGAVSELVVTSSSDFASSGLGSANLAELGQNGSREVQRGQERNVLSQLADEAAEKIYDSAVSPDF